MRLYHLSIAILAAALAACGTDTAEAPAPQASEAPSVARPDIAVEGPERRILAFGDSLFAGYGVGEENSYPALLEDALREQGINARIANAGVSGDTSQAGAQRLAFTLDAQAEKPDLVILELGGNDMLRGVAPDQTRASFEAMLDELRQRDIPVLLMGMRAPPNYGPEYQTQFDGLYAELASEYDAELIPFWLEAIYQDPSLFQSDRIHPTVEGIEALVADTADEVAAALPPVN
ncbi:arylesterase [Qipengyuania sp. XHP0211]|uniref:arylesterase n=1 Tax=Qipengyuania sp. XHP0211 TaxID=3038079 RepID=UPI00241D1A28|nr:arylesterase [Qipengyuania sp. XHP0211]MDG5750676.1 arylesterase [Qipengyuania sp. XHP0211]